MDSSVTSFSSYCTAPDHHSHHTSGPFTGLSMAADHSLPRPTSSRRSLPGSIDEPLRGSFVATSQCVFGFSRTASERASQTNLEPTPFLTTVARPVTPHDVEDVGSLNQLRQDPLFVDMPYGHQTNFIFPPSGDESSARVLYRPLRSSKARSNRNLRQTQTTPLLIRPTNIKQEFQRGDYQQKVPLYVPSQIIKPKAPILFLPRRASSLAQADPEVQTLDDMNDEIRAVSDESSMNRLSKASEWSTQEDRAHCRDDDHPSLRSEDPSVKSGDLGPWWKGQRFRAVFKKVAAYHPALEPVNPSGRPSQTKPEKEECQDPFKRTCGFYAQRMKQRLFGTYLHNAIEKDEDYGDS
jgi:hypothetical protein